jgi:hypothetical protein
MLEDERQHYKDERRREKDVSRQKRDVSFKAVHAAASGVRHLHYVVLHHSFISYAQDRTPLSIPPLSRTSQSIPRSMSTLKDRLSPRSYSILSGSVVPKTIDTSVVIEQEEQVGDERRPAQPVGDPVLGLTDYGSSLPKDEDVGGLPEISHGRLTDLSPRSTWART